MRAIRIIALGAVLGMLGGCTGGAPKPAFNPTPKPTRPGQVVIIAGDHTVERDPRDGEVALKTSAYTDGGLAVAGDGVVYFQVSHRNGGRIARLERDGTISLMKLGNVPNQLALHGGLLWVFSSYRGLDLAKVDRKSLSQSTVIAWKTASGEKLRVVSEEGRTLSSRERVEVDRYWPGSRFAVRDDGNPMVVSRRGDLYEATDGILRRWKPPGYEEALARVAGEEEFGPTDIRSDGKGGLILLGSRGVIRLPRDGRAVEASLATRKGEKSPYVVAVPYNNDSLLLLGEPVGVDRRPASALLKRDGTVESLAWGRPRVLCEDFDGSMTAIAAASPGGAARRPDGSIVISDKFCGRVLAFRAPGMS
ncbi:hypothetical protein [Actinomadura rugatobispora]|uniref:WD40 repeat domain-containing protein n=1 Tax=Actinomadura rugatobispora TaxID=1994 RepID=A0ABW1A4I9_9ACTN|nr:hypothetical protein GCM10010200_047430 [Actinomadura rugatobispora]